MRREKKNMRKSFKLKICLFSILILLLLLPINPLPKTSAVIKSDLQVELISVDSIVVAKEDGYAAVFYYINLEVVSGTLHYISMEAAEGIKNCYANATVDGANYTDHISLELEDETLRINFDVSVDAPAEVKLFVRYDSTKRVVGVTDDGETAYLFWYPVTFPDSGANYTAQIVFYSVPLNDNDFNHTTLGVYQNATDRIGFQVGQATLDNWDKYTPMAYYLGETPYFSVRVFKANVPADAEIPVEFALKSEYFDIPAGTKPLEEKTFFDRYGILIFSFGSLIFVAMVAYALSFSMKTWFHRRKLRKELEKKGIRTAGTDSIEFLEALHNVVNSEEYKMLLAEGEIRPEELRIDYDRDSVLEPEDVTMFITDKLREHYINKLVPEFVKISAINPSEAREMLKYANPYALEYLYRNLERARTMLKAGFIKVEEILQHPSQLDRFWNEYLSTLRFIDTTLPAEYRNLDLYTIRMMKEAYENENVQEMMRAGLVSWEDLRKYTLPQLLEKWRTWKKEILSKELRKHGIKNIPKTASVKDLQQALEKIKMPEYQFLLANGTLHPDHVFYYTPEEIVYMSGYAKRTGVRDAPTIIFERAVHEEEVPQLDPVEYAIFIQEKASKIVTMLVTSAVRKKYIEILDSSEKGFTVRVLRNRCAICNKPLPKFNFYMCLTCESTGHLQHLVDENGFCRICGDKAKVIEIKPKYYEKLLVELAEDGFLSVEDLQQVLDVIAKRVQNMVWRADWNKIRKKHEQYIRRQWYRVYHSPYPYYYYYRGYYYRNGGMDWLWMWLWLDKEYQKLFDGIRNLIPQPGNFKLPEPPSWLPDEFKKLPEFAHHQITEAMEKFVIPKSIEELAKSLKLNVEEMVSQLENATDLISKQLTNNFENFSKKITELISSCVTHDDCHSACHSACVWSACHSACHSAGGWG